MKYMTKQNFLAVTLLQVLFLFNLACFARGGEAIIGMICVTEFPSTSFLVEQKENQVLLQVIHHNGPRYAPLSSALVTANDLEVLKSQAEFIQSLGNQMDLKWKRSGCNADRSDFFQCVGSAEDSVVNQVPIHPWALTVSDVEEKTLWGNFKKKNIALRFSSGQDSAKKDYQVTMDYGEGDCVKSAQNSEWNAKLKKLNLQVLKR